MKKGGGTANADTPGAFNFKDSNTINTLSQKASSPKVSKDNREGIARRRNYTDSIKVRDTKGELAAAKQFGNFTRAVSEGGVGGQKSSYPISTTNLSSRSLNTIKAPYGKGLPANDTEPSYQTKAYQIQQNKVAKEGSNTFPTGADRIRGTYQGYKRK